MRDCERTADSVRTHTLTYIGSRLHRTFLLALLLVASGLLARPAHAVWPAPEGADLSDPANWPSDPSYGGQWNLWSFMPAENAAKVTEYERSIGSGFHADRAWQRTIGDRRIVIAVIDSGIRWRERDLVNQFYLNRGELPIPNSACGTATGSDPYDVNGDGFFNVQDYTTVMGAAQPVPGTICDPAVSDANSNGILDPQDLIMLFSDDVDDDSNGWIDDISGWDMFDDDNDPNDDTDFGHGSGEARDSAAQTDNALGDAGVCPRCLLLMVRAGDSFVVDSGDFGLGTVFAVDSGASVIQSALGGISGPSIAQGAIDYAWEQNVVVIASAADEDSFHANQPGSGNHTIYVHANTFNKSNRGASDSFLAFNNCTNYGPHLLLSTPGSGCSSEAVGKTSGIVGLLYAAALQKTELQPPGGSYASTDQFQARMLSGEELKQLLLTTVDDIYDPADATDPTKYVTYMGWEKRFGYGRTNVRNAVDAVLDLRIPPVVDVMEPAWFTVFDPTRTPSIDIKGQITYRKNLFDSYDYVVEWAPGIEPFPEDWTELAKGTAETSEMDGTLATWDISNVTIDNPTMPAPDVDVNRFMVTVRVRVTLNSSNGTRDGTVGEIRRAFNIVRDPDLRPGFPIKLAASVEASPKISDIDGDGNMELIVGDGDGTVHVWDGDGNYKPGWPQSFRPMSHLREENPKNHRATAGIANGPIDADSRSSVPKGAPAIGDLDGDGPEGKSIVVVSFEGDVYAWGADGTMRAGFPVSLDPANAAVTDEDHTLDTGIASAPVLVDLDGDSDLEILVSGLDAHLYAWHHDGSSVAGFPIKVTDGDKAARIVQTPSVGDMDGDGLPEIVVGTNEEYDGFGRLYGFESDGTPMPNWPRSLGSVPVLPFVGTGLPNSTAMADVDGDGLVDVATSGIVALPAMIRGDGTLIGVMDNSVYGENASTKDIPSFVAISNGSFGDLDNDGTVDLVWGGAGLGFAEAFASAGSRVDFDHHMGAWNTKTRKYLKGFPQRADDHQFFMNPAIADISGDGKPEIISGSGGYYLRAWDVDGTQPEGWPKFTGGWIIASPAVGDVDGDGKLEVAAATREGYVYLWNTRGDTNGRVDWASFHHDDHNTGNFAFDIGFGSRAGEGGGGCCRVSQDKGSQRGMVLLLLAVMFGLRRRRRANRR